MTAIFLAMLFSSSWICHGFYLGYSDAGLGKSIRIIAPAGYEGPVLIIWSVPGGLRAERKDGGRLLYYDLQDDGALLIEDDPPGPHPFGLPFFSLRGHLTIWRKLSGGHLQRVTDRCPNDASNPRVGYCVGGIGGATITENGIVRKERPFSSYIITTYENKSAAWDALFDLKTEYEDKIYYFPGDNAP